MQNDRSNSSKLVFPDFPVWLWAIFGAAIIAITFPLALQILQSGEFQHVCKANKGTPLHLRDWKLFSGQIAYVNAFGWFTVSCAGAILPFRKIQKYSLAIGIIGFFIVLVTYQLVCKP